MFQPLDAASAVMGNPNRRTVQRAPDKKEKNLFFISKTSVICILSFDTVSIPNWGLFINYAIDADECESQP